MHYNTLLFLLGSFFLWTIISPLQAQKPIPIAPQLPPAQQWASLPKLLNNKRIVALGENYHGVREYNALKLELVQYLHEEMGFNVLALEGDLAMSYFANAYRDSLTDTLMLEKAVTPVWHTTHHLELMAYLKAHPKLQLIGFDMITKRPVAFFAKELGVNIDSSQMAFQKFLEAYPQWEEVNGNELLYSPEKRDAVMAAIVQWIAEELYPKEKIIVSAHNYHISNHTIESRMTMGVLLQQQYKQQYYSIGFYNSIGTPVHIFRNMPHTVEQEDLYENSLQYQLAKEKEEALFIPITGQKRRKKYQWLHQPIYDRYSKRAHLELEKLSHYFDGIIWVRKVTAPDFVIENERLIWGWQWK